MQVLSLTGSRVAIWILMRSWPSIRLARVRLPGPEDLDDLLLAILQHGLPGSPHRHQRLETSSRTP